MSRYHNSRIEGADRDADALAGEVRADRRKLIWTGGMFVGAIVGGVLTISPSAVTLFVSSTVVTLCLGHSLGMHRRLIHRSYDCPKWLEYLFVHLGVIVGLAGPFGMAHTHDLRDWAQRQRRCHDYFSHGSAWYKDAWWQLFCTLQLEQPPRYQLEREIADDPVYQWMERTWMAQQLPWVLLFLALGGWGWVFWGVCARVSASTIGHWLVGYFAHNNGAQSWHVEGAVVQGYNVPWCALLTMGESWHNNHHAFPGSARLGLERGQWDPGWWILQGLVRLRLAGGLKTPQSLPSRPELIALVDA